MCINIITPLKVLSYNKMLFDLYMYHMLLEILN